jgi:hypothetical protein
MAAATPALAEDSFGGDVAGFVGIKAMNKDDWSPAEDQVQYGGHIDWQPSHWPIALTFAYYGSNGSGDIDDPTIGPSEFKVDTEEFDLGAKKFWETGRVGAAYVGGGLAYGRAKAELASKTGFFPSVSSSDSALGAWIGGGYLFNLGRHFALGVDARYSYYSVTLFDSPTTPGGTSASAGGLSFGGVAAYRW